MKKPEIGRGVDWRGLREKAEEGIEQRTIKVLERVHNFRELRKKLGLTQAQLASILNMTQSNVSKLEAKAHPDLDVLKSMVADRGKIRIVIDLDEGKHIEMSV